MSGSEELTDSVKRLAGQAGFVAVGVAGCLNVPGREAFSAWLKEGYHGQMDYLARNVDARFDLGRLVDGAASVICLAVSYAPPAGPQDAQAAVGGPTTCFVARYARGRDYHEVLKRRCRRMMEAIRRIAPEFRGRAFVDSAPVAERSLAAAAGLGWIGRNGCLIVPGLGSYVVLAEIVCNLELVPDGPLESSCGDCDACVRACPTGACLGDSLVDARRCLSYLTIEHRGPVGREFWPLWGTRVFGCDACQEACPHNRSLPAGDVELAPAGPALGGAGLGEVLRWSREDWDAATRGSACRRAAWEMFLRNAAIAAGNSGDRSLAPALHELRGRGSVAPDLIDWALDRLEP